MILNNLNLHALRYLILSEQIKQNEKQKNSEVFMKINVNKEHLENLAQMIYLGNTVINGYRKTDEVKSNYNSLADDIYKQIIDVIPQSALNYRFENMPNEKSAEAKVSDYRDKIAHSVQELYSDYKDNIYYELLSNQND